MTTIKSGKAILAAWAVHFIIFSFYFETEWFENPQNVVEVDQSYFSGFLLGLGITLYLLPLLGMYERVVKRMSAMEAIRDKMEEGEVIVASSVEEARIEWAKTGKCDCDKCRKIRAELVEKDRLNRDG